MILYNTLSTLSAAVSALPVASTVESSSISYIYNNELKFLLDLIEIWIQVEYENIINEKSLVYQN